MQQPIYFDNEIVQPKNLKFLNTSVAKNITDFVSAISNGGIVAGLNLAGVSGNNYYTVSTGYGYTSAGEKIQIYSGTNVGITFTGTQSIYLSLGSAVYNPDPSLNPLGAANINTNVDPTTSNLVAVENYNFGQIGNVSGVTYIPLGTVSANSSMLFMSANSSGSQDFMLGGVVDVRNNTINGINLATGSINSNAFTNPLTFPINIGTGANIVFVGSGNNSIGSPSNPLANVYSTTGTFHQINGMSPILLDSVIQMTGTSLEASGNNTVQIDTNKLGTQFGKGIYLNTNSISTVGTNQDINITTDAAKRFNVNTILNAAGDTFIKGNLSVSGSLSTFSANISSITNNSVLSANFISANLVVTSGIQATSFTVSSGASFIPAISGTGIGGLSIGSNLKPIATVYASNTPKAWVSFVGASSGPCVIRSSFNVWAVSGNAIGNYTAYFTNPFSNLNYAAFGSCQAAGIQQIVYVDLTGVPTSTSSFNFRVLANGAAGSPNTGGLVTVVNSPYINMQWFGY